MITGVHHIALLISSEECLTFYKKLGFEETFSDRIGISTQERRQK